MGVPGEFKRTHCGAACQHIVVFPSVRFKADSMDPSPGTAPSLWARRLTSPWAAAVLLAVFWLFMLASLREKSLTFDEIAHATAGYTYWRFNDYRLDPENGNLPQRLAGLPLLWGGFRFPSLDSDAWHQSNAFGVGDLWFNRMGNDPAAMLARGRAACGVAAVALGALVWWWSRRIFGPAGGMLSLLLFVLSPTILANGALMTSDTTAALFLLASCLSLWAVLQRLSPGRVLASALILGGLFVAKSSAILIVPIALLLVAARLADGRPLRVAWGAPRELRRRGAQAAALAGAALVHGAVVVGVIWACFGFRFSAFAAAQPGRDRMYDAPAMAAPPDRPVPQLLAWCHRHRLLPQAYLLGQAHVALETETRQAFLNGHYSLRGWKSFFPYTVLVKTPLPVFAVLLLAAAAAAARRDARRLLYATLPLWALIGVTWAVFLSAPLNIGHRHVLPTYPPAFVLAGVAADWLASRHRAIRAALLGLLALLAAEVLYRFPNYLAYFNVLAGGPAHAYRHLVDSSLDWGQDLPGVKRYLDEHQPPAPIYLSYFGMADPAVYHIPARLLYSSGFSALHPNPPPVLAVQAPAGELDAVVRTTLAQNPDFELLATGGAGDRAIGVLVEKPELYRLQGGTYFISATLLESVEFDSDGPWGAWNARYEATYQRLYALTRPFMADDPEARAAALSHSRVDAWVEVFHNFERYRFARLAAYLRRREPDDSIGYSILVYQLTDADVARALDGPPP